MFQLGIQAMIPHECDSPRLQVHPTNLSMGSLAYNWRMKEILDNGHARAIVVLVALITGTLIMMMNLSACGQQPSAKPSDDSRAASASSPDNAFSHVSDPASDTDEAKTIICIGDSITYGYGVKNPDQNAWPTLLEKKLGDSWEVVNLGVIGSTLLDEGAFPYRSTGNVERAKELDPSIVFIMLGSNDSADPQWSIESYRAQLSALVDELERASSNDVQIVLMAPPCTFYHLNDAARDESINQVLGEVIRPAVKDVAEEKGVLYIDLYEFTEDHPEWFPDKLHPNEEGNAAFADYLYGQVFR